MRGNKVYITSSGIIAGAKFNVGQKDFKIESEQYEYLLEHIQTRNIDRISKITLAAALSTLLNQEDYDIEKDSDNNYGIILGTQFSALESIHNYDMEALGKGALAVNPGLFPNTVLNSPACQVSIQFSFAGPIYTVCNGLTSSLDAIGIGYNFVKTGLSSMVLAGGVDELTELQTMMKSSDKYLGEAGGFLMLESEKTITENKKLAEVVGYKSRALNQEQKVSLAETVSKLIIDTVSSGGNNFVDITNISLSSSFTVYEDNIIISDICKTIYCNGIKECLTIDWMGACGIVQADKALKYISMNGSKNLMWALVNIDKDKVSAAILKRV